MYFLFIIFCFNTYLNEVITLVTKEDIDKIQQDLTDEQWRKFVFLLTQPELIELKKIIYKKSQYKFINVMRRYINKYIQLLCNSKDIKIEVTNLIIQSNKTLKNINKLIKSNSICDANSLLRSSFENVMTAMVIFYDEHAYGEFINLSINNRERKYSAPFQIRKEFSEIILNLENDLFDDISNEQLNNLFNGMYDGLCKFAHSSLIVNAVIELEKHDNLDLYIIELRQNVLFIEFIIYLCLKHLCNSHEEPLDITYFALRSLILYTEVPKEKLTSEHLENLYSLLHFNENKKYFNSKKNRSDFLLNDIKELQQFIEDNPLSMLEILKEYLEN